MAAGSLIHETLDRETVPQVPVPDQVVQELKRVDRHAIKLGEMARRWSYLLAGNTTRELRIYGRIGSIQLSGIIDQISWERNRLLLTDTKTTAIGDVPEWKQRLAYHQLLVYHEMVSQILAPGFDIFQFALPNMDIESRVHPFLAEKYGHARLLGFFEEAQRVMTQFQGKKLSRSLELDYINRKTGERQLYRFKHDAKTARELFRFRLSLFDNKREPLPLDPEMGSCRWCPFNSTCEYRQN